MRADYTVYKIALAHVLLIEGLDGYLNIHLASGNRPIVARMTMKAIGDKLPDSQFVRVHRSFIVPVSRIEGIRNKAARDIPVGASHEANRMNRFQV